MVGIEEFLKSVSTDIVGDYKLLIEEICRIVELSGIDVLSYLNSCDHREWSFLPQPNSRALVLLGEAKEGFTYAAFCSVISLRATSIHFVSTLAMQFSFSAQSIN